MNQVNDRVEAWLCGTAVAPPPSTVADNQSFDQSLVPVIFSRRFSWTAFIEDEEDETPSSDSVEDTDYVGLWKPVAQHGGAQPPIAEDDELIPTRAQMALAVTVASQNVDALHDDTET